MTETRSTEHWAASAFWRAITAPVQGQTYRNIAYLALAFPLGLGYFVGFVTGTALGIGLLITWVGLPILGVTLLGATFVAGFEARLASQLVGVDASVPAFIREFEIRDGIAVPGDGFLDAVKRLVTAPSTWTSVVLVLSKFVFGIVSFVALVTTATISAATIAAPLIIRGPGQTVDFVAGLSASQYTIGSWVVDTLPEALAVAAGGVVFLVVAINALNALARFQAYYTATLLRVGDSEG
jgi:hypothetical protein